MHYQTRINAEIDTHVIDRDNRDIGLTDDQGRRISLHIVRGLKEVTPSQHGNWLVDPDSAGRWYTVQITQMRDGIQYGPHQEPVSYRTPQAAQENTERRIEARIRSIEARLAQSKAKT